MKAINYFLNLNSSRRPKAVLRSRTSKAYDSNLNAPLCTINSCQLVFAEESNIPRFKAEVIVNTIFDSMAQALRYEKRMSFFKTSKDLTEAVNGNFGIRDLNASSDN